MQATQSKQVIPRFLVIGVGNEFRNDDAIGIQVARKLRKLNISAIQVVENSGDGANLMEKWKGNEVVVIVDASASGSEPGMIFRFDAAKQKLPAQFFHYSSHDFSVAEAVEMSRTLGQLPKRLVIYGIEGENFTQGNDLTPTVKRSGEHLLDIIIEELRRKN